jgi:hypothetical protein
MLKQGLAVLNLFHRLLAHVLVHRNHPVLVKHHLLHFLTSLPVDHLFHYLMVVYHHRCYRCYKLLVLIYNGLLLHLLVLRLTKQYNLQR